jgi:hypothetical protein
MKDWFLFIHHPSLMVCSVAVGNWFILAVMGMEYFFFFALGEKPTFTYKTFGGGVVSAAPWNANQSP